MKRIVTICSTQSGKEPLGERHVNTRIPPKESAVAKTTEAMTIASFFRSPSLGNPPKIESIISRRRCTANPAANAGAKHFTSSFITSPFLVGEMRRLRRFHWKLYPSLTIHARSGSERGHGKGDDMATSYCTCVISEDSSLRSSCFSAVYKVSKFTR